MVRSVLYQPVNLAFINQNFVTLFETVNMINFILRYTGLQVMGVHASTTHVDSVFSYIGLLVFVIWFSFYFYCVYCVFIDDQTVLRLMFNTKLKQYGDMYEKISTVIYFLYIVWKISFDIYGSPRFFQMLIVIDDMLSKAGVLMDYNKLKTITISFLLIVLLAFVLRLLSVCLVLLNLDLTLPFGKIYQNLYSDNLAFVLSAFYCFCLHVLRERYIAVNEMLMDVMKRNSWDHTMFVKRKHVDVQKAAQLQDQYICRKIRACAKISGTLYSTCLVINDMFGFAIYFSLSICLNFVILYTFYFMEATASGLFYNMQVYLDFLLYVFWQNMYSTVIIVINIYYAETIVAQYNKMTFIVHEIVNSDISPAITQEAMQLSVQLLHQEPIFTASGFYTLNYETLQQKARTVFGFMVMILQFVTSNDKK